GRVDSQIKLRGYRVEPAEIERVLEMSPAVARAAVAVRNDDLIAYLVPANGPIDRRALRASLKAQLPPHMVPSRLVTIERLPVTAHGKTDYAALPVSDP